jgi:hypothetical protein
MKFKNTTHYLPTILRLSLLWIPFFLRNWLVDRYVPRPSTLQQIDAFCVGLIAESNAGTGHTFKKSTPWGQPASGPASLFINSNAPYVTTSTLASAALVKSLNYVRALVQRHLPQYPHQGFTGGTMPTLTKPLPVLVSPRQGGLKWGMSEDREMAKAVARSISGLEEIEDEDQQYIAIDVLRWRWVGGKTQLAWAPSPVMMDRSVEFYFCCENPGSQLSCYSASLLNHRNMKVLKFIVGHCCETTLATNTGA